LREDELPFIRLNKKNPRRLWPTDLDKCRPHALGDVGGALRELVAGTKNRRDASAWGSQCAKVRLHG
jgi:hypothetical protein